LAKYNMDARLRWAGVHKKHDVNLPGCQTYPACPAIVNQLWERPILWHFERTGNRLAQFSAPAMSAKLSGSKGRNAHYEKTNYKLSLKQMIQIVTKRLKRINSICRSSVSYVTPRKQYESIKSKQINEIKLDKIHESTARTWSYPHYCYYYY